MCCLLQSLQKSFHIRCRGNISNLKSCKGDVHTANTKLIKDQRTLSTSNNALSLGVELINSEHVSNDTHREKPCLTQFIIRMAASDIFHMFTKSINFYTFHYHSLKLQMFEKVDSSNRR